MKSQRSRTRIIAFASVVTVTACVGHDQAVESGTPPETGAELPAGHPAIPENALEGAGVPSTVGVVLETMDGGGYTYARLRSEGAEMWTAGPVATLTVGDTVALYDAVPMEDFPSKALDRVFDVLYFVGAYQKVGDASGSISATVLEAMSGGGYSYVQVDWEGVPVWLAAPETAVEAGVTVVWKGGSLMRDFAARSLDRTFEEILFVGELSVMR